MWWPGLVLLLYTQDLADVTCWQSDKTIFQTIPFFENRLLNIILGQSSATLEIRNEMLSRHPASNPLENVGSSCERCNHFLLPNWPNNQRYLHTLNAGNARYGRLRMRRPGYKWLLGLIRPERKELNFLGRRPSPPIRIKLLIKNPLADKNCAAGSISPICR